MKRFVLFLFLLLAAPVFAQDAELVNYRCGINAVWGAGDGSDKGNAYMEEYPFHDKLSFSQKTVYLKSDTLITLSHNARNTGITAASGRNRVLLGVNGPDGTPATGDEGQIRYVVDEIWRVKHWSDAYNATLVKYPAYTAPITLGGLAYDTGHAVVGTTGAHPTAAITDKANFYWRGMVESNGDEWHVLRYADDDKIIGHNYDDAWASDGNHVLLCVNPKAPGRTIRATGNGQFYTTPKWTYWTHKIHDQTTYITPGTGTVTFELRDIYDRNISYRINGGSWTAVGADNVTLSATDFSDGTSTLEYRSAGFDANARTLTVVKNPTHPGAAETHGNLLWGDDAWTAAQDRRTRVPYAGVFTSMQSRGASLNQSSQTVWDSTYKGQGYRLTMATVGPHKAGQAATNALVAKFLGWTATASGAPRSFATYAKEMILESPLSTSYTGIEQSYWSSWAIPAFENVYRGYWDVNMLYSVAVAYDVLMGGFRSDQVTGGISPIEDYYIRDRLAEWVHHCQIPYNGMTSGLHSGMWPMARNVGAAVAAVVMPSYSSPYYGTSGIDGTTTTYEWTPYITTNLTWKTLFLTHDYTLGAYPYSQWAGYEFTEGLPNSGLGEQLIGPATITPVEGQARVWRDRTPYISFTQMGQHIALYANIWDMHASSYPRPDLANFLDQISAGVLYGSKWNGAYPSAEMTTPYRAPFIWAMNDRFPVVGTNARSWMMSLASNNNDSDDQQVRDAGPLSLFFYDDALSAPDATAPLATSLSIAPAGNTGTWSFNETVAIGAGGSGGFTLSASGGAVTATLGTPSAGTIPVTFSRTINQPETITWSYTQPVNGVEDSDGNDLATIATQTVTNGSAQGAADTTAPGQPTITSITLVTQVGFRVNIGTVTDAGSPPVEYRVSLNDGSELGEIWQEWTSSSTYDFSILTPGTTYTVRAQARDSAAIPNVSAASASVEVTTYEDVQYPPARARTRAIIHNGSGF